MKELIRKIKEKRPEWTDAQIFAILAKIKKQGLRDLSDNLYYVK